jgi:hypothetical protein
MAIRWTNKGTRDSNYSKRREADKDMKGIKERIRKTIFLKIFGGSCASSITTVRNMYMSLQKTSVPQPFGTQNLCKHA